MTGFERGRGWKGGQRDRGMPVEAAGRSGGPEGRVGERQPGLGSRRMHERTAAPGRALAPPGRLVRRRPAPRCPAAPLALAAFLVSLCIATPAAAQTDPRLAEAVRLAQEGLGDSARASVQRLLNATEPSDTLYPQVLYTRAVVATDPQEMRRDLQRVAVEYAYSSWADDALLRLAQLDYASANFEGAARDLERIRLDYPSSPIYATAALWAGRTYFDLRNPPAACRWLGEGLARVGDDIELRNQLAYYQQRCALASADTTRRDTARADSAGASPPGAPAAAAQPGGTPPAKPVVAKTTTGAAGGTEPSASRYRIQIAAVNSKAAADSIARKAKAAGLDVVVVKEKGLLKLRTGSYRTRAEAQSALARIRASMGGQPFVVAES
jgi:hypothetical protein